MYIRKITAKLNDQAGDTIVEVLIAAAILGFVIAGAAVAINRNILIMEDHQEHAQAIKLVQSQIEDLRSQTSIPANISCFSNTIDPTTGEITGLTPNIGVTGRGTDPCTVQNDGSIASATSEPAYTLSISSAGSTYKTYTIIAQWEGPQGSPDQVSMEYRPQ